MNVARPSQIEPFDFHYSGDPAFDTKSDAFDLERFRETGDWQFAPILNGRKLTTFTVRPLSSKERYFCQQKAVEGVGMLAWYAVAIALEAVDPFYVDNEPHKIARVRDGSVLRVSDGDMEMLAGIDDGKLVAELADRIFQGASNPKKS